MEIEKRKIGKKVDKNKELHFNNESSVNCVSVSKDVSGRIVVAFTYNSWLIGEVKKIPGYRWHPDKKSWSFPTSDQTVDGGSLVWRWITSYGMPSTSYQRY